VPLEDLPRSDIGEAVKLLKVWIEKYR
jgi:hypothetical protein